MPATYTDRLQGLSTSVAVKAPCRVATTANILLTGLQTIDGVALAAGDRVLVKNQSDPAENGIYDASASDWHRALDFDGSRDVVVGTQVSVVEGALQTDSYWRVTGSSAPRPAVDAIHFEIALFSVGSLIGFIAASRSILGGIIPTGVGQVAYLSEAGHEGHFVWRTGNYAPLVGNDPLQGIYVKSDTISSTQGCWVRVWDGIHGRPEWFGAQSNNAAFDNRAAILACSALCQTAVLGPFDYYISDTLGWNFSGKNLIGCYGSRDGPGTRIILTGANVVSSTVFRYGPTAAATQNDCCNKAIVEGIEFVRDCSVFRPSPSSSGDPINCVKGVVASFLSDCKLQSCTSYDSPVGFHCVGIVNSDLEDLTVHRVTAANNSTNDFYVAFLVGGYATNFGYLGANASIRLKRCRAFTSNPSFDDAKGMRLFGYIADTFVYDFEMSLMPIGIEIDGSDASGVMIQNNSGVGGAHQDVFFDHAIVDGTTQYGVLIKNINDFGDITFTDIYCATAATAVRTQNTHNGAIRFDKGKLLCGAGATGFNLSSGNNIVIDKTFIRDAANPVLANTIGVSELSPIIYQLGGSATYGMDLSGCFRTKCAPQITGTASKMTGGVNVNSACTQIEVNCTAINPGVFTVVTGDRKVYDNGAPVSTATAAFGTENIKSGVLT